MRVILFLLKCVLGFFAAIGFLLVAVLLAGILLFDETIQLAHEKEGVPESALLTLDLTGGLIETLPSTPFASAYLGNTVVLRDTIDALEAASRDPRVKGLLVRLGRGGLGMAQAQELRDAVLELRAKGAFAWAFAESFGEGGNGTIHYYLASAFDQVWLQPSGDLGLTGIAVENAFLRKALDKIGVLPRLDQREDYKAAMNTLTDDALPEPQRRNLQQLVDSWMQQISNGIAEGREIPGNRVMSVIDNGPYLAAASVSEGLVDTLGYWSQVVAKATTNAKGDTEVLNLTDYDRRREPAPENGRTIAVIYGLGQVVLSGSEYDPLFGNVFMGSDTVSDALAQAVDDDTVEAVVFRIDSPGGSYVASDAIWFEMQRAREAGKPVVVSMGDFAASGGYFVAAPAERIVAEPGSLTGSIGVVAGKLVFAGLSEKLGITWDGVKAGRNADIWSPTSDFSVEGWARLQAGLDRTYADFTAKVAEGRSLSLAAAEAAAKGQVWSGADAQALGLVDELGGFRDAVELARQVAGIDPGEAVRLKTLPEPPDPFEALLDEVFAQGFQLRGLSHILSQAAKLLAPLTAATEGLEPSPGANALQMPPLAVDG